MYRISRLQELMKGLPRGVFDRLVDEHQGDKHSKGFRCWDQLMAMAFGHLSGAGSLREIEAGFNGQSPHHYHLGTHAVCRSTLGDANRHERKLTVFSQTARVLMAHAGRRLRRDADGLLYLLDSTSIRLTGRGYDEWAKASRTRRTQGIKLHLLYGHAEQAPLHHSFSAANVNDVSAALSVPIEAGATYVFDKGYCDYHWWAQIAATGAWFVTRFKRNAALRVKYSRVIPPADTEMIVADEIVCLTNATPGGGRRNGYTQDLRRTRVVRAGHPTPLVLATNDLTSSARQIALRYKARWDIELYFKWIKQHLKIKRFIGRSQTAVKIQILCALITYLLLALYRKAHGLTQSLWHLLSELRTTLFQRPAIEAALDRRRRKHDAELLKRQPQLFP